MTPTLIVKVSKKKISVLRLAEGTVFNRPFPSSPEPLYQNEVKCSAFHIEMMFHSHSNKTYFQKKSCALGIILKVRVFGSRKSGLLQCTVVNKLVGQGLLYIRIKQAYNFVLHESDAGQDHSGWLDQDYLSLTGQLKDPPVPLHVMIRQGSSLIQVQVPVPTKRKRRQFLPLILKRRFPKVKTGLPDHGCTAHFENEIGFSQECLLKNDFVRAYYLAFD